MTEEQIEKLMKEEGIVLKKPWSPKPQKKLWALLETELWDETPVDLSVNFYRLDGCALAVGRVKEEINFNQFGNFFPEKQND